MNVYEMYDHFGELVGLVNTTMEENQLQEIWDEYVKKERDEKNDYPTIDGFVDIYRYEKEYDVESLCYTNLFKHKTKK